MSPSGKEESTKKTGPRPEPLCLFRSPEDVSLGPRGKTYVGHVQREEETEKKKRETKIRTRRRRGREPARHLKTFLLASVKQEEENVRLPSMFEVLETVKDAWTSPSSRKLKPPGNEDTPKREPPTPRTKDVQLLSRRLSVPEELMRKYSVTKEETSEGSSETNKTTAELSPSSSGTLVTARRRDAEPPETVNESHQLPGKGKKTELPKRVTQSEYYEQGKRVILVKEDSCTCREGEKRRESSTTTASAKEETEESVTSDSVPSSSPTQVPKRESPFSSSEILSSESDNVRCTCAELSSKETSTDFHLSGKSTLSQTVSEKSISTQDSTVSINSVSTGGSTEEESNSTTPERERTSAKEETTTSPDYSPRTPRHRKTRRRDGGRRGVTCPVHEGKRNPEERKFTNEELYMIQQLRHQKFVESRRKPPSPEPPPPQPTLSNAAEDLDEPILIPRYSALPRTLSMLVNTSSPDNSDTESLADSLEDQPTTVHVHKLYDTKKESKPVRGDVTLVQEPKFKYKEPRGRAFFVSMKDPEGGMLESIEKIPQPPEKIKNQIFERHLSLCAKHKRSHGEEKTKKTARKKQTESKNKVKEESREKASADNAAVEKNPQKPQAVIRPEPPAIRQPWNKQVALTRRSPLPRFRQRFEVIPEEKSSSLSSAEEKREGKFADAATSPLPGEPDAAEVPEFLVAKITDREVETLPYVKSGGEGNRKIILFSSSQSSSSRKGRDALIAMNREDFNRLAKGWMNFYKLNEAALESEEREKRSRKEPELEETVRLDSSNTILKPLATAGGKGKGGKKESLLPEIKVQSQKKCESQRKGMGSLPKVGRVAAGEEGEEETDTDSTDYMEPPSPRVPPLSIEGIPTDASLSSSESEMNPTHPPSTTQSLKFLKFKKKGNTNRTRFRNSLETSRMGKKKNSGWSVTVAGTVELSRSAPDLEMRLSFPAGSGPPVVSQSDSGFAEDSNYSKGNRNPPGGAEEEEEKKESNSDRKWKLTVNHPNQGKTEPKSRGSSTRLPGLEPEPKNPKKALKTEIPEERVRRLVERKLLRIWPEVQRVIKKEFVTESGRLITEGAAESEECLSVRGSAVALERKGRRRKSPEKDGNRREESAPSGVT